MANSAATKNALAATSKATRTIRSSTRVTMPFHLTPGSECGTKVAYASLSYPVPALHWQYGTGNLAISEGADAAGCADLQRHPRRWRANMPRYPTLRRSDPAAGRREA